MTDTELTEAIAETLHAAFLPECTNLVASGSLTGATPPGIVAELVAATMESSGIRRLAWKGDASRMEGDFSNAVYAGVIKTCEAKETERRSNGGEGYSGNGHHWAQRLTSAAVEQARRRGVFEGVEA